MEDKETPRMHKYGESKTPRIMIANVRNVISGSGLRNSIVRPLIFVGQSALEIQCNNTFIGIGARRSEICSERLRTSVCLLEGLLCL